MSPLAEGKWFNKIGKSSLFYHPGIFNLLHISGFPGLLINNDDLESCNIQKLSAKTPIRVDLGLRVLRDGCRTSIYRRRGL